MRKRFDTPEAEQLRDFEHATENRKGSSVRPKVDVYRGRVLVVDDSEDARSLLSTVLASQGFDALVAQNGEEALTCYRALHRAIDAVVLDMQMPGMDGADTFRQLKMVNASVKAIVCSGGGASERVDQALKDGALAFVAKPFSTKELIAWLDRAINEDGNPSRK